MIKLFLEKIDNYENLSRQLREKYSKSCPICKGTTMLNGENGIKFCDCVKKANIIARLICNGIPKKYINANWDINLEDENDKIALDKLKTFCDNIEQNIFEGNNMLIVSQNIMKNILFESIIANDLAFKKNQDGCYYNILMVTVNELIQTAYYNKAQNDIKRKLQKTINSVDILILNGLGDEIDLKNDYTTKFLDNILLDRKSVV